MASPGTSTTGAGERQAPPADGGGPPAPPAATPTPSPTGPRRLRSLVIGCVIAAALAIILFVGLGPKSGTGPSSGPVVAVGDAAPAFTLPSLTGGTPVSLDGLGRDRHHPVVLNFFASWCGPCQKETPLLARTAAGEQARGSTVQFIGVDTADKPSNALPFVQKAGITYPVGVDFSTQVTSGVYGLYGDPQTFFIDSSGKVVGHVLGPLSQGQLDQWLHRLGGSSG
jgi:cytochrome c biogenesis protein CcmG/thiol:disulfide interchange protein DsbE